MMLNLRYGLCVGVLAALSCKQPQTPQNTAATDTPAAQPATAASGQPAGPLTDPAQELVLIGSQHDTLSAAREGLEAALKLPVELPLPFPRVERQADVFRVILGRGKAAALAGLQAALQAAGKPATLLPAGQAGGDDVIRLGIVCTDGSPAPLYKAPLAKDGALHEVARLTTGQVVIPTEEDESATDEDERHGGGHDQPTGAESGYLTVLQPRAGLLPGPTVLLPADCTPRDEDNDDGNGRLLQGGRLCLTTRFSGKQGQVPHADLLAVMPNYRRCVRFHDAGTFDGFDHDHARTQFAVEAPLTDLPASGPAARPPTVADKAPRTPPTGLQIYSVSERGELTLRGQLPALQRPAYLGDHLVAVFEPAASAAPSTPAAPAAAAAPAPPAAPNDKTPGLVIIDGLAKLPPSASGSFTLPTPRRLFSFAPGTFTRLVAKVPQYRPAAPTLQDGHVRASFQESCRPDGEKRVRAAAKGSFVQCVMEVEVEVALDGSHPQQHCRLDNAQNNLDEPLATPCPT